MDEDSINRAHLTLVGLSRYVVRLARTSLFCDERAMIMELSNQTWMVEQDDLLILCDDALNPILATDWLECAHERHV